MAMSGATDSSDPTMSEINVTPLVDVMLVLLIIFMIKKDKKVDFAADRTLDYGFVVDVMAVLRRAGIEQVGMLTEPPPPERE
jgi:biopolymer transport protein TolR